ncbi:MAG: DMT family transporter [Chloroflexi bacterium]|nr:DMT family transporter [Chloroflexota bacterium]MBA3739999.1 DMT family transporter [Chloroflexota bacterium]
MDSTTEKTSTRLDWALFILLGFFWGSSYLFIKIGIDAGLEPFTLVSLRLLFGLVLLAVVVRVAGEPLPRQPRMIGHLVVLGFFSVALPFGLITWAEQSVDSSLAAVLTGAVPLFVIPFAALFLPAERITINGLLGIAVGLIGVAIVVGFDPADLAGNELIAEVALIGAAVSYAIGGVYARRNVHGLRPMIPALFQVGIALVMMAIPALVLERPWERGLAPEALFAVVWLGLLGSGAAYLIFFRLLGHWGATRTSLVAYLLPIWGIALGALVLQEPIDARLLLGTALVIGGIALVNLRRGSRQLWGRGVTPPAPTEG